MEICIGNLQKQIIMTKISTDTIKYTGKDLHVKFFDEYDLTDLERNINRWLNDTDNEIISIEFIADHGAHSSTVKYVMITYRINKDNTNQQ